MIPSADELRRVAAVRLAEAARPLRGIFPEWAPDDAHLPADAEAPRNRITAGEVRRLQAEILRAIVAMGGTP